MIEIINEDYKINKEYLDKIIEFFINELEIMGSATIKIGSEEESRVLNKNYRKKDYPTDVLTFILNEELPNGFYHGDIFICYPVMQKQAVEAEISEDQEMATLILHGLLHLKGYDHETDNGEMLALQEEILKRLNFKFR